MEKYKKELNDLFSTDVPDPLNKIKQDPRFRIPEKQSYFQWNSFIHRKSIIGFVSIFIIALLIITSLSTNPEPVVASTVTIDINPSILITLDENDHVIQVQSLNDDGDVLFDKDIDYQGLSIDEFVDLLIDSLEEKGYILDSEDYSVVLINVESDNEERKNAVNQQFQNRLNSKLDEINVNHWILNSDDIYISNEDKTALQLRFNQLNTTTKAKVILLYRLSIIQDEYTIEELRNMTLVELYTIYIQNEDLDYLDEAMPGQNRFGNTNE